MIKRQNRKWKIVIIITVFVFTVAAIYGWKEFNRSHTDTSYLKPVFTKTAFELVKEFESGEDSANKIYNDKILSVHGRIIKIENNDSMHNVLLMGTSAMSGVFCQFEKNDPGVFEKKKVGDEIRVKGVCTGVLLDVILNRCVLDEN
jgi:hypothetical protein